MVNSYPIWLAVRQRVTFTQQQAIVATALERNFNEYRPTFDEIFASFRITQ